MRDYRGHLFWDVARLHVSISEGYVDVIEVVGERKDKADILMSYFAPQMKHKVIKQSLLESGIKAAHKLQGVETEVILKKGFKPGSVKITLNTKNKKKPFMELLKPPPKPFEIYIEMEEEEELDLSQDQPSYIDNARHIIEKMKEIFDLDLNDPNEIATKISDLYMTHKDLFNYKCEKFGSELCQRKEKELSMIATEFVRMNRELFLLYEDEKEERKLVNRLIEIIKDNIELLLLVESQKDG